VTEVFSIKSISISIQLHMKLFKALNYTVLVHYFMFLCITWPWWHINLKTTIYDAAYIHLLNTPDGSNTVQQ